MAKSAIELEEYKENLPVGFKCSKMDQLQVGKIIGSGNYATVRLATHVTSGQKLAVKTYDTSKVYDPDRKLAIATEGKIMKTLQHPNIVRFVAQISVPGKVHLVMEFPGSQSLYEFVKSGENRCLAEETARPIFCQVVRAVDYLHSNKVSHRDIKLENILYNNGTAKLIDFGFAVSCAAKQRTYCGTPTYMAPELVCRKEYAPQPVDIWALGVLLYRMLTGSYPFKAKTERELFRRISSGLYDESVIAEPAARDCIAKMLATDPSKRMSALEAASHPYVQYN